jgi:hypothetical protein
MKFFIIFLIFLLSVLITESLPNGVTFLSCPNSDELIDCNKVECCPSDNTICCLDKSNLKEGILVACASIYTTGHALGCCGQKLCSKKK